MANKFTKSILERQAKEAKEHPKTAEPPKQPTPEAADVPQQLPPSENTIATEKQAAQLQLDQLLEAEEGRAAKNKTFYLDQNVIDAIHRTAKARGLTDSKLVNEILKKLLL